MSYNRRRGVMLKAIRILGTKRTKAIAIGSSIVQQNTRIWSNRTQGSVARIQTNMKHIKQVLSASTIDWKLKKELLITSSGKL